MDECHILSQYFESAINNESIEFLKCNIKNCTKNQISIIDRSKLTLLMRNHLLNNQNENSL